MDELHISVQRQLFVLWNNTGVGPMNTPKPEFPTKPDGTVDLEKMNEENCPDVEHGGREEDCQDNEEGA